MLAIISALVRQEGQHTSRASVSVGPAPAFLLAALLPVVAFEPPWSGPSSTEKDAGGTLYLLSSPLSRCVLCACTACSTEGFSGTCTLLELSRIRTLGSFQSTETVLPSQSCCVANARTFISLVGTSAPAVPAHIGSRSTSDVGAQG